MDDVHEEFVSLVRNLRTASPDEIPGTLRTLWIHTEEHFAQEERWMEETRFPARDCHAKEHSAVLASIAGVSRKVATGQIDAALELARALIDWLPGHANYLDSALAHWMCKKHFGGKPIVFRHSPVSSFSIDRLKADIQS
jgi:hemerythrin